MGVPGGVTSLESLNLRTCIGLHGLLAGGFGPVRADNSLGIDLTAEGNEGVLRVVVRTAWSIAVSVSAALFPRLGGPEVG
jgi:hypothetical protein